MKFSHRFFLLFILTLTFYASSSLARIDVTEHGIDVFFDDQLEQTKVDIQYSRDLVHWLPKGKPYLNYLKEVFFFLMNWMRGPNFTDLSRRLILQNLY